MFQSPNTFCRMGTPFQISEAEKRSDGEVQRQRDPSLRKGASNQKLTHVTLAVAEHSLTRDACMDGGCSAIRIL